MDSDSLSTQPSNRRGRLLAGIALATLSVIVTLGAIEWVLRSQLPASTHHLMYTKSTDELLSVNLRPNSDFQFEGVAHAIPPTQVTISSQGLRNPEVLVPKPAGIKRLLCVGDSTTFGWGVEEPDCFCRKLQPLLGSQWETINLGIPGYNTTQEVRRLQTHGLQYEPDVVMIFFDGNDYEPPVNHGDPDTLTAWLIDHVALVRWVHIRLAANRKANEDDGEHGDGPSDAERTGGESTQGPHDGLAAIKTAFDELSVLGKDHSFQSIVIFPSQDEKELMAYLKTLKIPSASVRSAFMGPPERLQIPNDGHPTVEGHRRLAEAMAKALRETKVIAP